MIDLKLFSKLQSSDTAFLLLTRGDPGFVNYFLMSSSVNYSVVTSGICQGDLGDSTTLSFDISLASIIPLVTRNNEFSLSYIDNKLRFNSMNGVYFIEPLCVQHIAGSAVDIASKYMSFNTALTKYSEAESKYEEAVINLQQAQANYKYIKTMELSSPFTGSPFGDAEDVLEDTNVDEKYKKEIAGLESRMEGLKKDLAGLDKIDLSALKNLANIASRYNTTVSMCGDIAIVSLSVSYAIQKIECGVRAVTGKLLHQLLLEPSGQFWVWQDELVFCSIVGTGVSKSNTVVFLEPYLPNSKVDSTLITKGAVLERYVLDFKGMLPVVRAVLSRFSTMQFDMGSSLLLLGNDSGEVLQYKFETVDSDTLALNKAMRGEKVDRITMAVIDVPREVQFLLSVLGNDVTVFVKKRKIIFQSGTLYIVFGR